MLPISRKEIGELINMTTENVIRILSEFRKDGLVRIDGKNIEILNKELLEKLSKSG
jgi:CRP/FNR family transcriptional regulator